MMRRLPKRRADSAGRLLLVAAVTVSLVQIPMPVVHAHASGTHRGLSGRLLGGPWLDGHLKRMHAAGGDFSDVGDLSGGQAHWHFVLPSQLSRELGSEMPELPVRPASELDATAGSAPALFELAYLRTVPTASVPGPLLTNRCWRLPSVRSRAREFVGSYSHTVPFCALIGIALQ